MANDLTQQLRAWYRGDRSSESDLFAEIYPVLRGIAHRQLHASRSSAITLQATDVAHEGLMRLFQQREVDWETRGQFYAIAATIMRRVVIDYLRERSAQKRGAEIEKISLSLLTDSDSPLAARQDQTDWLRLDQVLTELESFDRRAAQVIELRYFVGMTVPEIAALNEISVSSVERQ